jgi:hypothetical protein
VYEGPAADEPTLTCCVVMTAISDRSPPGPIARRSQVPEGDGRPVRCYAEPGGRGGNGSLSLPRSVIAQCFWRYGRRIVTRRGGRTTPSRGSLITPRDVRRRTPPAAIRNMANRVAVPTGKPDPVRGSSPANPEDLVLRVCADRTVRVKDQFDVKALLLTLFIRAGA